MIECWQFILLILLTILLLLSLSSVHHFSKARHGKRFQNNNKYIFSERKDSRIERQIGIADYLAFHAAFMVRPNCGENQDV